MFKKLWSKYPAIEDYDKSALGKKIGGFVEKNIQSDVFTNTCALRMSYALNRAGISLPFLKDHTVSGYMSDDEKKVNKKWHHYRVSELEKIVKQKYTGMKVNKVTNTRVELKDKQGIVFFHRQFNDGATGHAALWNGKEFKNGYKDDHSNGADSASFYKI